MSEQMRQAKTEIDQRREGADRARLALRMVNPAVAAVFENSKVLEHGGFGGLAHVGQKSDDGMVIIPEAGVDFDKSSKSMIRSGMDRREILAAHYEHQEDLYQAARITRESGDLVAAVQLDHLALTQDHHHSDLEDEEFFDEVYDADISDYWDRQTEQWARKNEAVSREHQLMQGLDPQTGERFAKAGMVGLMNPVSSPEQLAQARTAAAGLQVEESEIQRSTQDLYSTAAPVMGQAEAGEAEASQPRVVPASVARLERLSAGLQGNAGVQRQADDLPTGARFDRLRALASTIRHDGPERGEFSR